MRPLFTRDVKGRVGFYERVLGMKPTRIESDNAAEFALGDLKLFIHVDGAKPAPGFPPNEDHIAFGVENVDGAWEELRKQSLKIEFGPRDFDWGRSAYLRDPDGRLLELHQI